MGGVAGGSADDGACPAQASHAARSGRSGDQAAQSAIRKLKSAMSDADGCANTHRMTVHIACLTQAEANRLTDRWATAADRSYTANRMGATRSLSGRAALRALLARVTGRNDWQIRLTAVGRPCVQANGPSVSISHAGDMIAVAVAGAETALGIDIEPHRVRNFSAIARLYFGPAETEAVAGAGCPAFYRIWTAREALAKARGVGLEGALGGGDLVGPGVESAAWMHGGGWFRHCYPADGYSLTLAITAVPDAAIATADDAQAVHFIASLC